MTKKILFTTLFSLLLCFSSASFAARKSHASTAKAKATISVKQHTRSRRRTKTAAQTDQVVKINRAEANQFATLKGIGLKKAERIVLYREENGKFKSIDDLRKVKGISEKTIEKNRERLKLR